MHANKLHVKICTLLIMTVHLIKFINRWGWARLITVFFIFSRSCHLIWFHGYLISTATFLAFRVQPIVTSEKRSLLGTINQSLSSAKESEACFNDNKRTKGYLHGLLVQQIWSIVCADAPLSRCHLRLQTCWWKINYHFRHSFCKMQCVTHWTWIWCWAKLDLFQK